MSAYRVPDGAVKNEAGLALALTAVGIYGVLGYFVTLRTQEIGTRLALGALPADVLRMIVTQGAVLTAAGVALGIAGALSLRSVTADFLYGVAPHDPASFAAMSILVAAVSLLASYLPARRASRVDPMIALRSE